MIYLGFVRYDPNKMGLGNFAIRLGWLDRNYSICLRLFSHSLLLQIKKSKRNIIFRDEYLPQEDPLRIFSDRKREILLS